jgi:thiamine-monophosphate kinase
LGENFGEFELIERLRQRLDLDPRLEIGIGDDAAVVPGDPTRVVSVDAVVDGVHFDSRIWPASAVAWKAIAAALSDIGAMAADPTEVYLSLGLPSGLDRELIDDLIEGTAAAAGHFGVAVAGGDTVGSPVIFLAVTAVGEVGDPASVLTRAGAKPGDLVAVTGEFGGAAAGLRLVEKSGVEQTGETERALVERLLRPEPRLAFAGKLRESGVSALIDVSDGLVADLGHIASMSGVGIEIDVDAVPVQAGVEEVARLEGIEGLDLALTGGEDYELALVLEPGSGERLAEIASGTGVPLTVIGTVVDGSGVMPGSKGQPYTVNGGSGFEHRF